MRHASIFAGAMGLDIGLERNGFETAIAVEKDPHAIATIKANRPSVEVIKDAFEPSLIQRIIDAKVDAILGGPPCQSWSYAGNRKGLEDQRGLCIPRFLDIIEAVRPRLVAMENVMGLLSAAIDGRKGEVVRHILTRLMRIGYAASLTKANAADNGAPQLRHRVVILAVLGDGPAPTLRQTHDQDGRWGLKKWATLRDAIGDHPKGDGASYPPKKARIFALLKGGQNWKDLPEDAKKEAVGKSSMSGGGWTGFYRRLSWDKPCPTLTTSPTCRANAFCHPDEVRPLNVAEYARIQQFPDDWRFEGPLAARYRQIGNAIPVGLGEAIGKALTAGA